MPGQATKAEIVQKLKTAAGLVATFNLEPIDVSAPDGVLLRNEIEEVQKQCHFILIFKDNDFGRDVEKFYDAVEYLCKYLKHISDPRQNPNPPTLPKSFPSSAANYGDAYARIRCCIDEIDTHYRIAMFSNTINSKDELEKLQANAFAIKRAHHEVEESTNKIESIKSETKEALNALKLLQQERDLSRDSAKAFKDTESRYHKSAKSETILSRWFMVAIIAVVIIIIFCPSIVSWIYDTNKIDGTCASDIKGIYAENGQNFDMSNSYYAQMHEQCVKRAFSLVVMSRLSFSIVMIILLVFFGRIYKATKNIIYMYEHKISNLHVFDIFYSSANGDEGKNAVLLEGMKSIFHVTPAGFVEASAPSSLSESVRDLRGVSDVAKIAKTL